MINLYYHADRNNYLVPGTTNRTELALGFYVKYGDGGVDMEPLSHLYKSQIYKLGEYLDVPEGVQKRSPSPDTYSLPVSDQEFFFCVPYDVLDVLLYAYENSISIDRVCSETNLAEEQVQRAFRDLDSKRKSSWHLREVPVALE
jgi:NAD+ synthase